jgi:protein-disulfide isomerase
VDLTGLSAEQKATAVKILAARDCGCTCGMKVTECRVKDPNCAYSKGVASTLVAALKAGKTEAEAIAAADASQWAHVPARDTRILGDVVKIPTDGAPVIGPANARVKLVEFSDFQCPFCILAKPQIDLALKAYPDDVSLTFKQFPLDTHSQAAVAAVAALAAQKQGKFWPMHDALFAQKGDLSQKAIMEIAGKIGLSLMTFNADLQSPELKKAMNRDEQDGLNAGVEGTPTLFMNGRRYNGAIKLDGLKLAIEQELKKQEKPAATASVQQP